MCPERTQRPRRPGRPRGTSGPRYPRGPKHTDRPFTRCYHNKELITTELSSTTLVLGGQGPRGPEAQRPRGPESNRPRERPIDQKLCTFFSQYLEEKNKIVLMMHINNIFFPLTIYRKRSPRMELTVGCQNYWQKEGYFTRLLTRVFFIE